MKISLNWLKQYIDIPLNEDELSTVLTDLGLEVEGMEKIESIKGGLKGIVVGHVKECGKHPNADKLSLTKVDVGADELLQIVCGAPNVAEGQKVMVATIGTTLYDPEGKAWKIKKGKIRGEASQGMICAEDEIGVGSSHEGIIVLPADLQVGTPANQYYELDDDVVYDIGLTPNRSDATSHIGVAKDLAAYFKVHGISDAVVNIPDSSSFKIVNQNLPITVSVENQNSCPRYSGVSISNVNIKESPDWLKNRLNAIGVRPISNIVDITNYVLHEYGQPLHAFDYDKIANQKVIVKNLPDGTIFKSLDEQDRKLHSEDLMICDGDSHGMCIGGVFGGLNSGVTDNTKNIFLEAAHFNAKNIRRTSTRHQLRTDAAICFEKGTDPNVTVHALKRACVLIQELAGGTISSDLIDIYPEEISAKQVQVSFKKITDLIGVEIPKAKLEEILGALNMPIAAQDDSSITVSVPTDKADVTRDADVIEEILRIYGFNNVPIPTSLKSTIIHSGFPDRNSVKELMANMLSSKGYHEMMNLSISKSSLYNELLPAYDDNLVYINNTSNTNLDVMRPELMLPTLETALYNQNRQQHDLKLFEIGRSYQKKEEGFDEQEKLIILVKGNQQGESWLNKGKENSNYFHLKRTVHEVLDRVNIKSYQVKDNEDDRYDYSMSYCRGKQMIVQYGKVSNVIANKLGLKGEIFYAELDINTIYSSVKKPKVNIEEPSKYPSVRRDLALVIGEDIKFGAIENIAKQVDKKLLKNIGLFDVYKNKEQLGEGKKSYAVSFGFENREKTLNDKEVDKIMNKLISKFEESLNATIRK